MAPSHVTAGLGSCRPRTRGQLQLGGTCTSLSFPECQEETGSSPRFLMEPGMPGGWEKGAAEPEVLEPSLWESPWDRHSCWDPHSPRDQHSPSRAQRGLPEVYSTFSCPGSCPGAVPGLLPPDLSSRLGRKCFSGARGLPGKLWRAAGIGMTELGSCCRHCHDVQAGQFPSEPLPGRCHLSARQRIRPRIP